MSRLDFDCDAFTLETRKKRKLNGTTDDNVENISPTDHHFMTGRRFLHLRKGIKIYETEDWQTSCSSLFMPLKDDVMVNSANIEQFSCTRLDCFVAGTDGLYSETVTGDVLHLWRFSPETKKLYISRSFLFKHPQDFLDVQQTLLRL